ncbi:unnamed protein product [Arctogadus glacialis]
MEPGAGQPGVDEATGDLRATTTWWAPLQTLTHSAVLQDPGGHLNNVFLIFISVLSVCVFLTHSGGRGRGRKQDHNNRKRITADTTVCRGSRARPRYRSAVCTCVCTPPPALHSTLLTPALSNCSLHPPKKPGHFHIPAGSTPTPPHPPAPLDSKYCLSPVGWR